MLSEQEQVTQPQTVPVEQPRKKQRRGFAIMDPALQRAIASKGGKTAHAEGTAHKFTSEEAKIAGAKGGKANSNRHRFTSDEAKTAGHIGGKAKKIGCHIEPKTDESTAS